MTPGFFGARGRWEYKYTPKAIVATDLGIAPARFSERLNQVEKFYLKGLFAVARVFNVEDIKVLPLASTQYEGVNGIIPAKTKGSFEEKIYIEVV